MDIKALVSAVDRSDVTEAVKTLQAAFRELGLHLIVAVVANDGEDKRTVAILEPGKDAKANLAAAKALRSIADMDGNGQYFRTVN